MNRSVSDVSDILAEEERKKATKDRRHKQYKSDPLGKFKAKNHRKVQAYKGDMSETIVEIKKKKFENLIVKRLLRSMP